MCWQPPPLCCHLAIRLKCQWLLLNHHYGWHKYQVPLTDQGWDLWKHCSDFHKADFQPQVPYIPSDTHTGRSSASVGAHGAGLTSPALPRGQKSENCCYANGVRMPHVPGHACLGKDTFWRVIQAQKEPHQINGVEDLYLSDGCTPWICQVAIVVVYWQCTQACEWCR